MAVRTFQGVKTAEYIRRLRMQRELNGLPATDDKNAGKQEEKGNQNGKPAATVHNIKEAVVKTRNGRPDMRFKENHDLFLKDKTKRTTGIPDERILENREDILGVHESRGDLLPNVEWEGET